jgi:hypothetical protein
MAMNRIAFRRWAEAQDGSVRYERVLGEPVAMAPERAAHARLKARSGSSSTPGSGRTPSGARRSRTA